MQEAGALKIVKDIKEMRIRGAERIARAGIKAWSLAKDKKKITELLVKQRPNEPMLRNLLFYLNNYNGDAKELLKKLDEDDEKISSFGSRYVANHDTIYTHCNSSTVEKILIKAKEEEKEFVVNATETRPLFQGRTTAINLAKKGIKVKLFVDSAAKFAIREATKMFIGCDCIEVDGVINKVGSSLMVDIANRYDVPVYVATHSLKFDPLEIFGYREEIEERSYKEIWEKPPKGVEIKNIVFERIKLDNISAIITELGVMKPESFFSEVKKAYPWLFEMVKK
ncbi:MAG: translation initiation factor eIF-2B [Candidatus Micrarchaeales archaeon]